MRRASIACLMALAAGPALAADVGAANLYGRDPGVAPAYACFSATFDVDWLQAHPAQNVTRLMVFANRRAVDEAAWDSANLEMSFRDSKATYHASAECGGDSSTFGCSVDCEGGGFRMTAVTTSSLSVTFDGYLRFYDTTDNPLDAPTSGFQPDDQNLMLRRTELRGCLPLIADDQIKARVEAGTLTH
jgi:hypothetical protein